MARIQIMIFEIDGRKFGVNAQCINGILRARKYSIQKIPSAGDEIEGMINLRGNVSYIFNLRKKFKMACVEYGPESKIVMINLNNVVVGCLVDEVTDIVHCDSEDVEAAPPFMGHNEQSVITGICKIQEELIIMLNLDRLLTIKLDAFPFENMDDSSQVQLHKA